MIAQSTYDYEISGYVNNNGAYITLKNNNLPVATPPAYNPGYFLQFDCMLPALDGGMIGINETTNPGEPVPIFAVPAVGATANFFVPFNQISLREMINQGGEKVNQGLIRADFPHATFTVQYIKMYKSGVKNFFYPTNPPPLPALNRG